MKVLGILKSDGFLYLLLLKMGILDMYRVAVKNRNEDIMISWYGVGRPTVAIVLLIPIIVIILLGSAILPVSRTSAAASCVPSQMSSQEIRLQGHIPPIIRHLSPIGYLDCQQTIRLSIALKIQHPAELDAFLAAKNDPASPDYHQYLTPQQFADRFAPPQHTIDALISYLDQQHITVTESTNHMNIQAYGTVAAIEQAFSVHLARYQLLDRVVFAPTTDPAIPGAFAGCVQSIIGLDDVARMFPVP